MTTIPGLSLRSGATIPLLGFGTWQIRGEDAYDAVAHALRTGYRHLDTATMYRNEREVGRAIADSGLDRAELFVTTKLPPDDAGRERQTLAASLEALGLDHLDLWLIHWPPNDGPGVESWREFRRARDEGLVTDIGVSNYATDQIDTLVDATGEAPAVNQIKWAPALYDGKRHDELRERGVVLEGYSPFRASDLDDPVLRRIADAHGVSTAQVILRWHLQHEIVVIPKSVHADRIEANFAVTGFELTDEEMGQLDALGG